MADYYSLNKFVPKRGLNSQNATSVRQRLGFKPQVPVVTRNISASRLSNSVTRFVKPGIKTFDARQKLSGRRFQGVDNISDARQKLSRQTKIADARQRIDMKKRQLKSDEVSDMRTKILEKRRMTGGESVSISQQPAMQVTVPGSSQIVRPGQKQQPGLSLNSPVMVTLTGQGRVMGTGTVAAIGGSIKKTIISNPPQQIQPLVASSLSDAAKLRITTRNELALRNKSALVTSNKPSTLGQTSQNIPFQVKTYSTQPRPIETIITCRPERSAGAAESAAARIAVRAAAAAAARTDDGINSAPAATQQQRTSTAGGTEDIVSPLQGYRTLVSNLHVDVTLDDIMELFGDIGPLKNAHLVKPGMANVIFVNVNDAITAHQTYHMRELDGQPMSVELKFPLPSTVSLQQSKPTIDLDVDVMQRALFKTVADAAQRVPVNFTVQL